MARTEKLTERALRTFKFEGATSEDLDFRWDSTLPGFGVQVRPNGRVTFIVYFRTAEGRQRRMTLGAWGVNRTLEQARREARQVLTAAKDGADPLEQRRTARTGETVKDLVDEFLEQYADVRLRTRTAKEYRRQLETYAVPRWGTRLAKTIKRADVARLHSEIGASTPTQANRVIAAVGKLFTYAKSRGFVSEESSNPARGIERYREAKRDRWVKPTELPRIAAAIDGEPRLFLRAYFWMLLFTGLRRTEARLLRWSDVDLERGEIRLGETKAHRTHMVPLSGPAQALLESLPRFEKSPYVFPGKKEGQPIHDVNKPWKRVRDRATVTWWTEDPRVVPVIAKIHEERKDEEGKLTREILPDDILARVDFELPTALLDIRIHDLRRSLGSWLASYTGASLPLIGAILNHSSPSTTMIYAQLGEDPRRQALEDHGQRVVEAAKRLRVINGGTGQ